MTDCPSELEADMQQTYGVDMRTYRGGAGHLAALAANLGPGSRALAFYDPFYGWTREELLLAQVVDLFQSMGLKKGEKLKNPMTPEPKGAAGESGDTRKMGVAVDINLINKRFGLLDRAGRQ